MKKLTEADRLRAITRHRLGMTVGHIDLLAMPSRSG
jgi:hypothetical protein